MFFHLKSKPMLLQSLLRRPRWILLPDFDPLAGGSMHLGWNSWWNSLLFNFFEESMLLGKCFLLHQLALAASKTSCYDSLGLSWQPRLHFLGQFRHFWFRVTKLFSKSQPRKCFSWRKMLFTAPTVIIGGPITFFGDGQEGIGKWSASTMMALENHSCCGWTLFGLRCLWRKWRLHLRRASTAQIFNLL